jgi:hypothetical protein
MVPVRCMTTVTVGLLLLLAACATPRAGNAIPTPNASEQARDAARYADVDPGGFVGAKIGAHANQLTTVAPVTFDHARWDTAGLWDSSEPTRLTIPAAGFYHVEAQVTVLGSGYAGSPASPSWVMSVIRNGDATDFVCSETRTDEDETVAQLAGCSTTDWFLAGDYLELSVTPGRTVESNWPGRGNVSPILLVTAQ